MRKALLLFAILIICGVAGFMPLRNYLLSEKEQVRFEEHVLKGDSSLVEGVTVKLESEMDHQLFWKTACTLGQQPESEYQYYDTRQYVKTRKRSYDGVRFEGLPNFGSSGSSIEELGKRTGFGEAFEELERETGAGSAKSKTVYVKDYYEYYPVLVGVETEYFSHVYSDVFWAPGNFDVSKEEERKHVSTCFQKFFRMPVLEEELYVVEIVKNRQGNVTDINGHPGGDRYTENGTDMFYWRTATAWDEEYCYFTFVPYSVQGKQMDTSQIQGGFGIYRLPFYRDEKGEYHVKAEELAMVYSLEPETVKQEVYLEMNADGELLLITGNDETVYLRLIDTDEWELRQELTMDRVEEKEFHLWHREEDFLVCRFGSEYLLLIDRKEERGYELQFMIATPEDSLVWEGAVSYRTTGDFAWNGKQLLYAVFGSSDVQLPPGSWFSRAYDCDFSVAVYDATGEIFLAEYLSGQYTKNERVSGYQTSDGRCVAIDSTLEVQWGN